MKISVTPKNPLELYATDILFQTSFWGQVKNRLGWETVAFDISSSHFMGDVLALIRNVPGGGQMVHVPQGPEYGPDPESYGVFLEVLSQAMADYLAPDTVFIRYDLPWKDPYDSERSVISFDAGLHRPNDRIRELRMNMGTNTWNLKKAPLDLTVPDSLILDLRCTEDQLLTNMKPKTRYNVGLAQRKGVEVINVSVSALPEFYALYCDTAHRNGFPASEYRHFVSLFDVMKFDRNTPELFFYLARKDRHVLAGAIVACSENTAMYLFGASSTDRRHLMASYELQWHAIRHAKRSGYRYYDMGAVSPVRNPVHPFYGMYRFKTGFGGQIVHRAGSWDYTFQEGEYDAFRRMELISGVFGAAVSNEN